jgi:DNA modification methylase
MKSIEEFKNKIICGDALEVLQKIPDESVDCIITSPPYWGLRDYGVEGQIGLEYSLEEYLEKLLKIIAELKRVLKPTGILFLNHGDCYGGSLQGYGAKKPSETGFQKPAGIDPRYSKEKPPTAKLKAKCLVLQNWRLVLRMIDKQGWLLRNVIIWHKPNHMPSSVKDRFTNSYEPVFMLVKSKKYYFDLDAIRIPPKTLENKALSFNYRLRDSEKKSKHCPQFKATKEEIERYKEEWEKQKQLSYVNDDKGARRSRVRAWLNTKNKRTHYPQDQAESFGSPRARYWREKKWETPYHPSGDPTIHGQRRPPQPNQKGAFHPLGKNPGDLWSIPTQPAPPEARGKHFAIFPEKLVEPMIKAGCPKNGIVLDPFCGSGTTCVVAKKLGRNYIGIDISKEYCEIAEKRLERTQSPLIL